MRQLIENVEDLLRNHNFVTIPGFGGFVAETAASIDVDGTLYPPHKEIGFNSSINYNDGLLAQQYAMAHSITLDKASEIIASDVANMVDYLNRWRHLQFGSIGMFHLSNNALLFEPSPSNNLLSSAYGLTPVFFPVISTRQETAVTDVITDNSADIDTQKKTNNSVSFSYKIVAAAAILLLLILFPLNLKDPEIDSIPTQYASFLPNVDSIMPTVTEQEEILDTVIASEPTTSYSIVIASFKTKRKARQYINEVPAEVGAECSVVYSNRRYVVSYKSFDNNEQCSAFRDSFKLTNPRFAHCWILTQSDN